MFIAEEGEGYTIPAERSLHTSVPPANVRIQNFTRKQFKEYDRAVNDVKSRDAAMYAKKR